METVQVDVVLSLGPRQVWQWPQTFPTGTTLAQAIGLVNTHIQQRIEALHSNQISAAQTATKEWQWGVWGRVMEPSYTLQPHDRLEAYRALKVDPKVARRERFAKQGARGAGLFAQRRKGSKPGY